jgi:hypothetical protein
MKSYETLQAMARKNTAFHSKINGMGVVQGEPILSVIDGGGCVVVAKAAEALRGQYWTAVDRASCP